MQILADEYETGDLHPIIRNLTYEEPKLESDLETKNKTDNTETQNNERHKYEKT